MYYIGGGMRRRLIKEGILEKVKRERRRGDEIECRTLEKRVESTSVPK